MAGVENRTVSPDDDGIRLDRWFKRNYPDLVHGRLQKLLRKGQVRVDGGRAKAAQRVAAGQIVRVPPLDTDGRAGGGRHDRRASPALQVAAGDLHALEDWILFEDEHVLVLNKPAGVPVQGGTKSRRNLDLILAARPGGARARLVHRLDKDTSGVLALGKTAAAAASLAAAFRDRDVRKLYWALTAGVPSRRRGRVDEALVKRAAAGGEKVVVAEDQGPDAGDVRQAATRYATVDHAGKAVAWLALMPITGRTHQIRVHCAALGAPVAGDGKYGGADAFVAGTPLARQLHLHARRLVVPHPKRGLIDVTAPLPPHMADAWRHFGFEADDGDPFDFDAADRPR